MQDEMQDLLEQANEIQESLGRSYDVGEVDETDLEDGNHSHLILPECLYHY